MVSKPLPKIIFKAFRYRDRHITTKSFAITAVLQGFNAIDTASQLSDYTREPLVGEALQELDKKHGKKREDLWLQAKFIPVGNKGYKDGYYYPYNHKAPISSQIRESFQTSLSNLHTSYLDSYILHDPLHMVQASALLEKPIKLWNDAAVRENVHKAWKGLGALRDEGVVRAIGVSSCYDVDTLRALMKERKIDVVQNNWFGQPGWDKEVVAYCRENGIMYQASRPPRDLPLSFKAAHEIAQRLQCTPEKLILRIAQDNGITPLVGTVMRNIVATEDLNLDTPGIDRRLKTLQKLLFQ